MRLLRSLFIWFALGVLTIVFGIPSILAAFLPPRGNWYLAFARGWARSVLFVAGVRVDVEGLENVRRGESFVFFSNHESLFDIFVLLAALPGQVRFLAKKSLFHIPILGWSMAAAGFVPVDRDDRKRAAESLEIAGKRLRGGKSVIIFPEQTRTRTGDLLPFKKGGVLLALKTQFPIVPVAIGGTFSISRRGAFTLEPGPAAVVIGQPIPTTGRTPADRTAILEESRDSIAALRERAREIATAPVSRGPADRL